VATLPSKLCSLINRLEEECLPRTRGSPVYSVYMFVADPFLPRARGSNNKTEEPIEQYVHGQPEQL
jgi:hypothetical protein